MNNNQNKTKLKASAVDFIGPLLKRLAEEIKVSKNSQMATTIDQIKTEVLKTKDSIGGIQKWDWELIGLFGKIERQIDSWIDHNEKRDEMKEITVMNELNDILCMLSHIPKKAPEKAPDLPLEVGESSNRSYQGSKLLEDFKDLNELDVHAILCLYSLGIFPANTELEKRFVIYWWIGLGLLPRTSWEKAKMHGNTIYCGLKKKGFLKSVHNGKQNQVINRCTINPTVHKWLLSPNMSNVIFSFDQSEHSSSPFFGEWFKERVHINLDKKYLNVDNVPINKELQVVHLGSWRYTEAKADNNANETGPKKTMSIDHIEIENPDVLKKLSEKTTYLSLRGISGIEEIPESIGKLENLIILDLRSCHNLIKLPEQPRSTLKKNLSHRFKKLIGWGLIQESWFNKLMVLDISGCYLLDHMPKWISELCNLEVLKGFLVGSVGKKNESCWLGDLSKLKNLKKLSIRTTTDMSPEVFRDFNSLECLLILTITWGEHKCQEIPNYSLPKNLEKLDIRCYPKGDVSNLMNRDELTKLKKLYMRGGNLTEIPSHKNWKVEKLRLRFLKNLVSTDWEEVRALFPNLNYMEYVGCPRPDKFPNDGICWIKEKDEPSQSANYSET
ncbi:disease resistance RPP13-like protein 4 [Carex rostrata]